MMRDNDTMVIDPFIVLCMVDWRCYDIEYCDVQLMGEVDCMDSMSIKITNEAALIWISDRIVRWESEERMINGKGDEEWKVQYAQHTQEILTENRRQEW